MIVSTLTRSTATDRVYVTHQQQRTTTVHEPVLVTEEQALTSDSHVRRARAQRRRAHEPLKHLQGHWRTVAFAPHAAPCGLRERRVEIKHDNAPAQLEPALGHKQREARAVGDRRRGGVEDDSGRVDDERLVLAPVAPVAAVPGAATGMLEVVVNEVMRDQDRALLGIAALRETDCEDLCQRVGAERCSWDEVALPVSLHGPEGDA